MTVTYHPDMNQGSEEWFAARCGLLTASEMHLILTPTLKIAANDKQRSHLYELLAQRITRYVEPRYVSDDMLRGHEDEFYARALYAKHFAPVAQCGFVTNDRWGFTLGYSPDGLVGADGLIECKSRAQKYQIKTLLDYYEDGSAPDDFMLQCQTGMLVTERKWVDLISYSGGLPTVPIRVNADAAVQAAIIDAASHFEAALASKLAAYNAMMETETRLVATERRVEQEIYI